MNPELKIYQTPLLLAEAFASELKLITDENSKKGITTNIVLSGGNTPRILFKVLSDYYRNKINWKNVALFWGDERCVPPEDEESNYGMTNKYLLNNVEIPRENIHRIIGENIPEKEADRYAREIDDNILTEAGGFPKFDLVILGMGEDGHTASIFPGYLDLFNTDKICAVTKHPVTNQMRITLTGRVLNSGKRIVFMITGDGKAEVIKKIIGKGPGYESFPASHIHPVNGQYEWYLDAQAAKLL